MKGTKLRAHYSAKDLWRRARLQLVGSGTRVLLCRPRGGLNDSLCQIEKCRDYALQYGRKLYVDGSRSGFQDNFGHYFISSSDITFIDDPTKSPAPVVSPFQNDSCPSYVAVWSKAQQMFVDQGSGEPLTFDFGQDHRDDFLLHEQCGGGTRSIRTLARLTLRPHVAERAKTTLQSLGDYDAAHVRNTDLTTDYKTFFSKIDRDLSRDIVVCTDDYECQAYAKRYWGDTLRVVNELVDLGGAPLHRAPTQDRPQINEQAVVDLLVLASAKELFVSETDAGRLSGFTRLAMSLRRNPRVISRLLSAS